MKNKTDLPALDETGRSMKRGMPSARGLEWRKEPGDGAFDRYQENFDRIPRNPDGTMREDSGYIPVKQDPDVPRSCDECSHRQECPDSCFRRSEACKRTNGLI